MLIAITRPVPRSISNCELTHLERVPIDFGVATAQHEEYERQLAAAGCAIVRLAAEDDMPDSVFVEDAVLVLDEVAIAMNPGASSRRGEVDSVVRAVADHRPLRSIVAPSTIDGGDVLVDGRTIFVGISSRSTSDAAAQLRAIVQPFGYEVRTVELRGCLHLKSAATAAAPNVILLNPQFVDEAELASREIVHVDPTEPGAANLLRVDSTLFCGASYPRTRDILARRGLDAKTIDLSELAKAEGALTCCSVIFPIERVI